MRDRHRESAAFADRIARAISAAACTGFTALLGWIVVTEPTAAGLGAAVRERVAEAAVRSEVTAVLLDFRGYDTMLEAAVLVAALVAIWSLERGRPAVPLPAAAHAEPVLAALLRAVVPVIVLVSVYLVWRGAYAPGGAFQGGALFGGAIVLVLATGFHRLGDRTRTAARYFATAGLGVFLGVATILLGLRGAMLDYPSALAYPLVLVIELFLALATAAILADLFVDVPSVQSDA
jgi:multisubunit Na+/H+ antiporter MnhB subunit